MDGLDADEPLQRSAAELTKGAGHEPLRWFRASIGQTTRLIAVDDVVPSDTAEQSADWSADCEPRRGAGQLSPNRHRETPQRITG